MKYHLNALLQRMRSKFEGRRSANTAPAMDGYDWLAMIKDSQASVRPH